MRKFRHIETGYTCEESSNGFYKIPFSLIEPAMIPSVIIENSNDWEEIIEKKPLFVTEDGVEVFEGDRYHSVSYTDFTYKGNYISENPNCGKYTDPRSYKKFSTYEAAQKYIDLHKPKYSLKDVEEALCNHGIELFKYDLIDYLKNLNK